MKEIPKGIEADEAEAKVLMPILLCTEVEFRVVDVQALEIPRRDERKESRERLMEEFWRPDVVIGRSGKEVAGVDAHPHAILVVDEVNNLTEILEARAEDVALASHVLQYNRDVGRRPVSPVDGVGDKAAGCCSILLHRAAGMKVVEAHPEGFAPLKVVKETVKRLLSLVFVRIGLEIDATDVSARYTDA